MGQPLLSDWQVLVSRWEPRLVAHPLPMQISKEIEMAKPKKGFGMALCAAIAAAYLAPREGWGISTGRQEFTGYPSVGSESEVTVFVHTNVSECRRDLGDDCYGVRFLLDTREPIATDSTSNDSTSEINLTVSAEAGKESSHSNRDLHDQSRLEDCLA